MRAELYRPDAPEDIVAVARWRTDEADVESLGGRVEGLERLLRRTPVVSEDPSLRGQGTHGSSVLQPGTLAWFRAALLARAPELGLAVRFVSEVDEGGWDPAGQYRPFDLQVSRIDRAR